uniref:Fibronectin type-III domain-containing protein n=1 Tax=Schistocephalus solidus TaxID=70667 RepID=A0A183TNX0_SCHSO
LAYANRYPPVMDGDLTTYEMTALRPNTTYRLIVIPRTKAGAGIEAFVDITTLDATVAPAAPTFFVSNIGDTTFNVTYEPSHRGLPGSVFFAQYREPGVIEWQESLREFIVRTFHISRLTPSTQYEVRMVATNGAQLSTASTSIYVWTTGPPVPGGLQGASATWFVLVFLIFLLLVFMFALFACIRNQRLKEVQEKAAPTERLFEPSEGYQGAPSQMNQSLPLGDLEEEAEEEEEEENRMGVDDDVREEPEGVEEAVQSVRSSQRNAYDNWSPERRQQQRRPYYEYADEREEDEEEEEEEEEAGIITPHRARVATGDRAWIDEPMRGASVGPASDRSGYINRDLGDHTAYERESALSGSSVEAASSSISGLRSDRRRQRTRDGRSDAGFVNRPTFI